MSDAPQVIPMATPVLGGKELAYLTEAIKTGWISSAGRYVGEFEERFSAYCGGRYGITTTSGTTALHLALATLGVGPGDEVILPALTIIATANAVTYTGATPILVDSEPSTWGMDPQQVAQKITPHTKAIMPVHLYGHPVDIDPILELARRAGVAVVEDAAEAHGAEYKGRRIGGHGDLVCFSFYANKIITTGEGGMIVTRDPSMAERARLLRDQAHERKRRFLHRHLGYNYRMTNLQAAVGLAQLERIDEFVEVRRRHAHQYNSFFSAVPGITLPPEASWAKNVHWMYSVLIDSRDFGASRDEIIEQLKDHGIESRSFFTPVHEQPLYQRRYTGEQYPVAEELSRQGLNLPSGNELTEAQVVRVAETLKSTPRSATLSYSSGRASLAPTRGRTG